MRGWGKVATPQVPSQRSSPSDMTIAQLLVEAKLILRELNVVNDQIAEALGVK